MIAVNQFQHLILEWFDQHGRKHLPWQQNKTPYRIWISEIMLQQTQVHTVIPYYERFLQKFPNLKTLASATEDDVLHLWAGLGYYSRARNLYRASKMMFEKHRGEVPATLDALQRLPGIGLSTAGAILAIAYNQPAAILDGNVKRVLSRIHAICDPINDKQTENQLWMLAERYTPQKRIADYTQAMMDLGATLCTRRDPQCHICPLTKECLAHQQGIAQSLPKKKSPNKSPKRDATFLIFKKEEVILLKKRPPIGIWGGLWSLPEIAGKPDKKSIQRYCKEHLQLTISDYQSLEPFRHTFSHFHLEIHPILIKIKRTPLKIMETDQEVWYNPRTSEAIGLPKPVETLVRNLYDTSDSLY